MFAMQALVPVDCRRTGSHSRCCKTTRYYIEALVVGSPILLGQVPCGINYQLSLFQLLEVTIQIVRKYAV